jgi:hypothetical protein
MTDLDAIGVCLRFEQTLIGKLSVVMFAILSEIKSKLGISLKTIYL